MGRELPMARMPDLGKPTPKKKKYKGHGGRMGGGRGEGIAGRGYGKRGMEQTGRAEGEGEGGGTSKEAP